MASYIVIFRSYLSCAGVIVPRIHRPRRLVRFEWSVRYICIGLYLT
jgi:hypothetical protein